MSDVSESQHVDSLRWIRFSAASIAATLAALLLVLIRQRVSLYEFPDYGDLWRWAMTIHVDEQLTAKELFSEANIVGHNHVLTIWLSSLAAGPLDYSLLWWSGFAGVVLSIGSLAFYTGRALTGFIRAPIAVALAVMTGLLAFRFDQRQAYFSSLLVFEQFYYFFALLALLIGARLQTQQLLGASGSRVGYAAVGAALFLGEAPAALSLIVLVGMALIALPLSGQKRHLVSLLAVVLAGFAVKWVLRALAGGKGAPNGPSSAWSFLDPRAVPDWLRLIGASTRAFFTDRSQSAPGLLYLFLGLVIVVVLAVALVGTSDALHREGIGRHTLELALAGMMLIFFALFAAMFIVDTRGLSGRYDLGRFGRSTQFAMAGVALVGLAVWVHGARFRHAWRFAVLSLVALVLLLRVPAAFNVWDEAVFRQNNRATEAAQLCAATADFEWEAVWRNAGAERGAKFGESELFARWQRERCPVDNAS